MTKRKQSKNTLMDRTRAAIGFCNSAAADEGADMAAFMALFHPRFDPDKTRKLINEARDSGRRRRR